MRIFHDLPCSPPFWHRKQMIMLRNIMEGKYSFMSPEWSDISGENSLTDFCSIPQLILTPFLEDPKDLIRKCLVVDPEKRITVRECLKHPFFNTVVSKNATADEFSQRFPRIFVLLPINSHNFHRTHRHYLSFQLSLFCHYKRDKKKLKIWSCSNLQTFKMWTSLTNAPKKLF